MQVNSCFAGQCISSELDVQFAQSHYYCDCIAQPQECFWQLLYTAAGDMSLPSYGLMEPLDCQKANVQFSCLFSLLSLQSCQ